MSKESSSLECPICMELYLHTGQHEPRILTSCGHTVCHSCIGDMLASEEMNNGEKALRCPCCKVATAVKQGDAASLPKNYALASAAEEAMPMTV
jgi:hypothetical protein